MSDTQKSIFIVTKDKYPPFRVDITELYLRYLSSDYQLTFLMRRDEDGRPEPQPNPNVDYVLPEPHAERRKNRLLSDLALHIAGIKRILRERPDIIQCRDTIIMALPYLLLAMLIRRPFVYWMSYPMELGNLYKARELFSRGKLMKAIVLLGYGTLGFVSLYLIVLRLARHIFVQSDQMKKDVAALGISKAKITAVPMGINLDLYNPDTISPSTNSIYDTHQSIFYSGTLDLARNMDIPSEGVARFIAQHRDWIFVIAGRATQEEREVVRRAMRLHGVEAHLVFLEHMPLEDMLSHVKRAGICISPYPIHSKMLRSATPTKLVEYLAIGKRVVANSHPDQIFLLNHTGLGIVTEFSPQGFDDGLQRAFEAGEPSPEEVANAKHWLDTNRAYRVLSGLVADAYRSHCIGAR